jgi:hypothetical protein
MFLAIAQHFMVREQAVHIALMEWHTTIMKMRDIRIDG